MITNDRSIASVWQAFSSERLSKRRLNTRQCDRGFLRFCEAAEVASIDQIDLAAVERYEHVRRGCAYRTRRLEINVTKCVLNWCVDKQLIERNPIAKYRCESMGDDEANPHRSFTLDELTQIIAAAHPPIDIMIKTAVLTGMRRVELCGITWADTDLDAGLITLPESLTKTKASRFCVLGPRLVSMLGEYRKSQTKAPPSAAPLVFPTAIGTSRYSTFWKAFNRTCRRARIDMQGAHIHSLRVTTATLLYCDLEAPSAIVDLILGHGAVRDPRAPLSVRRYLKPQPDKLRPWAEKLEALVLS